MIMKLGEEKVKEGTYTKSFWDTVVARNKIPDRTASGLNGFWKARKKESIEVYLKRKIHSTNDRIYYSYD